MEVLIAKSYVVLQVLLNTVADDGSDLVLVVVGDVGVAGEDLAFALGQEGASFL